MILNILYAASCFAADPSISRISDCDPGFSRKIESGKCSHPGCTVFHVPNPWKKPWERTWPEHPIGISRPIPLTLVKQGLSNPITKL